MTQEQRLAKLKSFLPSWFWENESLQLAFFSGVAKAITDVESVIVEYLDATTITNSAGEFLDAHGSERTVERLEEEFDEIYSPRVQSIRSKSFKSSIKSLVDMILLEGTCQVKEDHDDARVFFDRDAYFDRSDILIGNTWDMFSIIFDQENDNVWESIVAAVDQAKAAGVLYRLVERVES
jgi:hypothetical protein